MSHLTELNIRIIFILLFVLVGRPAFATNPDPKIHYAVDQVSFDIPGHGELILDVPRIWDYNFTITDEDTPPLLTFYNLDNNQAEIFQLNMSVLWEDGFNRTISSPQYIRSLVQQTGENTLTHSDQTELTLIEITGANGVGYLFDLTDSDANEGEYHYLTQGAIGVGNIVVVFSLFSNDKDAILREAMLNSLKSAQHRFRNDV